MSEKIALGFCNNVDYEIVWNDKVFQDLATQYQIGADELHSCGPIKDERDLVISILSFMSSAGGGERFVASSELIENFAGRFEKKVTLGGTSVRAANAMRTLGQTSALHLITQNDHVRRLIPADSPYVCSNDCDSSFPHLIVQYPQGAYVRAGEIDIRARTPNRLIYHCNADRIALNLNEDFADLITNAEVMLISGFNAIQSERVLEARLHAVSKMLDRLSSGATVFLEDGAYYDPAFRNLIFRTLGDRIDIFSLNEDELQNHLRRAVNLRDEDDIRRALAEDLRRSIPAATHVVHTRHWALAHVDDASRYAAALKAGVTMATTRFRYGDDFTSENYRDIESRLPSATIGRFAENINNVPGNRLHCVPVADVNQTNATTIGLGDAFVGGFLPALLT